MSKGPYSYSSTKKVSNELAEWIFNVNNNPLKFELLIPCYRCTSDPEIVQLSKSNPITTVQGNINNCNCIR